MFLEGLQPRQVHTSHMQFNTLSEAPVHVATRAVQVRRPNTYGAKHTAATTADVVCNSPMGNENWVVVSRDDGARTELGSDGVFEFGFDSGIGSVDDEAPFFGAVSSDGVDEGGGIGDVGERNLPVQYGNLVNVAGHLVIKLV